MEERRTVCLRMESFKIKDLKYMTLNNPAFDFKSGDRLKLILPVTIPHCIYRKLVYTLANCILCKWEGKYYLYDYEKELQKWLNKTVEYLSGIDVLDIKFKGEQYYAKN